VVIRAALVAALVLAGAPAVASATEVSRSELVALAEEARGDEAALAELRAVTEVEGATVDLETALDGAEGEDLDSRLELLARSAETAPSASLGADDARAQAEEILADPPEPPPVEGEGVALDLPAPSLPLAVAIALLVLALAVFAARRAGQRTVLDREATTARRAEGPRKPGDLEREANEAERRGDFATAVRLRFQAGLARLDELGTIDLRPSLTASGVVRESGIQAVEGLAGTYERIAFGEREANESDAETQRSGWRKVVAEAKRKR
jgi:hypothetical protein